MVKFETVGMFDDAVNNPTLKAEKDVVNHSFQKIDDVVYLIDNVIVGDDAYKDGVVIKKGEFLRGYDLRYLEGQKLVIDGKHIQDELTTLNKDDVLEVQDDGTLKKGESGKGVHLVITDKDVVLTEAAVKAKVVVADVGE